MSDRIKIGLVTPAWPGHNTANGITTAVYNLALGLREIGQPPVVLSRVVDGEMPKGIPFVATKPRDWSFADKLRAKFDRAHVETVNRKQRVDALVRGIEEARAQHGLDVVIIEETQGWAGDIIPHVPVPVVICLHGPWLIHKHLQSRGSEAEDLAREDAEKSAFLAASGLLSPSRNVLAAIEDAYDVSDIPRQVIANSFQVPVQSLERPDNAVLFIGRYDLHKGGDTVLKAFEKLAQTNPEARLTFVGPDRGLTHEGGEVTWLKDDVEKISDTARSRLSILGQQNSSEILHLRGTHSIALIASRYENLNYTLLEAMASGQAIVSTAVGGPAEVLRDGETALLVPPDDPSAMASALKRLLDDPELAERLGKAARAEIASQFSPEKIAVDTVAFCREVLARSPQLGTDLGEQPSMPSRQAL